MAIKAQAPKTDVDFDHHLKAATRRLPAHAKRIGIMDCPDQAVLLELAHRRRAQAFTAVDQDGRPDPMLPERDAVGDETNRHRVSARVEPDDAIRDLPL